MRLRDYIQIGLATVLAALLIKVFVLDAVMVSSPSMERTLLVGDLVLVNKMVDTYGNRRIDPFGAGFPLPHLPFIGTLERGDVIVFRYPGDRDERPHDPGVEYIKRLVGLPGDTVELREGELFINGKAARGWVGASGPRFPRDRADDRLFPRGTPQNLDYYGPVVVPKAGDVVPLSERTLPLYEKLIRHEGHTVESDGQGVRVDGKRMALYPVEQNYLFVLGDNNYASSDSRFWGFLPEENLIGKATFVYWSKKPGQAGRSSAGNSFLSSIRWDRVGAFIR